MLIPMSLTSLPTFPTLKKHPSLQVQPTLPTAPSKFGTTLVSSDHVPVIAAATEAVALANAAVEAARDAVSAAAGIGKGWPFGESENGVVVRDRSIGFDLRRKRRRRKRRKDLGCLEEEENQIQNNCSRLKLLVGSATAGFLSSTEEAELCLGLKVYI